MGKYIGISLALAVFAYVGSIGAVADLFFGGADEVEVAEMVQARQQFTRPLRCDATVRQRSDDKWTEPRCYVTKATRGGE